MSRHKITIELYDLESDPDSDIDSNTSCSHEAKTMPGLSLSACLRGSGMPRPFGVLAEAVDQLAEIEPTPLVDDIAEAENDFISIARALLDAYEIEDRNGGRE